MAKRQNPGTQSDRFESTSDMRPVVPPCDSHQFAESTSNELFGGRDNYFEPSHDRWNNEAPAKRPYNHENSTAGESEPGSRQFSSGPEDIKGSGYAEGVYGNAEIPYGQGAAFDQASTTYVSVDRADRSRES